MIGTVTKSVHAHTYCDSTVHQRRQCTEERLKEIRWNIKVGRDCVERSSIILAPPRSSSYHFPILCNNISLLSTCVPGTMVSHLYISSLIPRTEVKVSFIPVAQIADLGTKRLANLPKLTREPRFEITSVSLQKPHSFCHTTL